MHIGIDADSIVYQYAHMDTEELLFGTIELRPPISWLMTFSKLGMSRMSTESQYKILLAPKYDENRQPS